MSGRKMSEVTSSLNSTETAVSELRNSHGEASGIFDELNSFGIDTSPHAGELASIEQLWRSVTSRMANLKERIEKRDRARESHYFDSEYKEAKEIESQFSKVRNDMRNFVFEIKQKRNEARLKHQAKADALGKLIADLDVEITDRQTFGLFQSTKSTDQFTDPAEFAEMIGLGPTHLDDVKNLIGLARQAVQTNDLKKAEKLLSEAAQIWQHRKTALQQLQDMAANDASTARAIAEFFADRGLSPTLELANGQFRLIIRANDDANADALYTATFRPYIDRGNQAEHIVWDTPEGTGCCNIVADLNVHMRARGFLHSFTSKTSGGQNSVESSRSAHRSKTVDRRRV